MDIMVETIYSLQEYLQIECELKIYHSILKVMEEKF